jgi:hypothetical protein
MGSRKRVEIHLGRQDQERLEMMRQVHGVSFSAALRMALRAACRDLGMEPSPPAAVKEK